MALIERLMNEEQPRIPVHAFFAAAGAIQQSLTATLTSAGGLVRQPGKPLSATFTNSGGLLRQTARAFTATLTSAGALIKQTAHAFIGGD